MFYFRIGLGVVNLIAAMIFFFASVGSGNKVDNQTRTVMSGLAVLFLASFAALVIQ